MSLLNITKTYEDDVLLTAADIDAIIDSVEQFLNVTRLNDDNISNDSITAFQKIKTATITEVKFQDLTVTEDKLAADSVTTTKILDQAVTNPKLADDSLLAENFNDLLPLSAVGTTIMFHTFNGTVNIPRGWMICNGDVVTEANYDALHGSGSFAADSIADSVLFAKFLPDMVDKYAVGTDATTQTGNSAISSSGAPNNTANFSHSHTLQNHTHNDSKSLTQKDVWTGNLGVDIGDLWQPPVGSGVVLDTLGFTSVDSAITADVQPESIEFIFIMKVI